MILPVLLLATLASATPLAPGDLQQQEQQPANRSSTSWACPEYALGFDGDDITHYNNIPSWEECGKLGSSLHR